VNILSNVLGFLGQADHGWQQEAFGNEGSSITDFPLAGWLIIILIIFLLWLFIFREKK